MSQIPLIRSFLPSFEEYCAEIRPLWDSHMLTNMAEKHGKLEHELAKFLDVPNLSLFANGHLALEMTIQAFHMQGEVITTPFTFVSTTHAIKRNNLTPVFCDIEPDTFTIDAQKIEALVNENTAAIVPVHVYGNVCDVEQIDRIAQKYHLKVIYDAAHAFGVGYKGKGIGNYGDASMYSFHATKFFHTIEGGAVAFSRPELKTLLYELKNFGIHSETQVEAIGANAKMSEFHAAMGLCNLRHIHEVIQHGKQMTQRYNQRLQQIPGLYSSCWKHADGVDANYAYYPLVVNEAEYGKTRDEVVAVLRENNIVTRKYFYPLVSDYTCYRSRYSSSETPVAQQVAARVLTLPMHFELAESDVDKICGVLQAAQG